MSGPSPAFAQGLNETCTATLLNRQVQVSPDGTFAIGNVPVPTGPFRVRIVCERDGIVQRAQSQFVTGVPNGVTLLTGITFAADQPIPLSLQLSSPATVLTNAAPTAQLVTTGRLPNGTLVDLTLPATGTFYDSSNPSIATVSPGGLVSAVSSGTVLVTARNEGAIGTIALSVQFGNDADGIPDDFERANGTNPGGSNLARLPGTQVVASSFFLGFGPERAIDGNVQTSWFTAVGDAANLGTSPFIEIILPTDANLIQIRLFGNREFADGFDFFAGIFQAFDSAGTEIFNSGVVQLPPPNRDVTLPINLTCRRQCSSPADADL